ncbi:MAG: site-specific integrase [Proteobacteria bacterium]|nr:site-specific integrase [Pseudomonadota bacterium]
MRAIYNKAIEWGWDGVNPSNGIKKFKEKSRDRFLQQNELPRFFDALAEEPNEVVRDYILLSMFTGARKSNMLAMRWCDIDLDMAIWRIPDTKNGDPVVIPLVGIALEILKKRKLSNDATGFIEHPYVFPGQKPNKPIADPKRTWKRVLKISGISNLRLHDLRRTLGSWQAMTGATTAVIGKSLGHKSKHATAVYERLQLDPVRAAFEAATEAMYKHT